MSRCVSCNSLLEYEYNLNPDLCWVCQHIVRAALRDTNPVIPKDHAHQYARSGLTPAKPSAYES